MDFQWALSSSSSVTGTPSQQLAGTLDGSLSNTFTKALESFSRLSADELQSSYVFYSNIQVVYNPDGSATNGRTVNVTQDTKTIAINWSADFSNLAGSVGVTPDEALRKTGFPVYESVIQAAVANQDLNTLTINGAWRPSVADYRSVNGHTLPVGFRSWWGTAHETSDAVDINLINCIGINGGTYRAGTATIKEPAVINDFIQNLAGTANSKQLFSPWQMNSLITTNFQFSNNAGISNNEKIHENYIHLGTDGS